MDPINTQLPPSDQQNAIKSGPPVVSTPLPQPVIPTSKKSTVGQTQIIGKQIVGSERVFRGISYGFELLRGILIVIVLLILTNIFVVTIFRISGESMMPNFQNGEFILVDRLSYTIGSPQRGDVVILQFPGDPSRRKFIKRVIGLPGETVTISNNAVFVNNEKIDEPYLPKLLPIAPNLTKVLRNDEVFVMGDNRPNSDDSRFFGPVPKHNLIGVSRAILSGKAYGFIALPAY